MKIVYSSKDFALTSPALQARVPPKLIHRNVGGRRNASFSEERRHGVAIVDLPSRTLNMTLGHLRSGQSTRRHRHSYETMVYIIRGRGYTEIEHQRLEWAAGDALYIPGWAWHCHCNTDSTEDAEYLACENAALLQNLGDLAVREEAPDPSQA
jgi:gentisate 1,2-dioxygenase